MKSIYSYSVNHIPTFNLTTLYGATVSLQSELPYLKVPYNVTDLSTSLGLEGSTSKLILSINSSSTSRFASNVFSTEPIPKVSNRFKFNKIVYRIQV